jgi:integrase/recombinase XerD
VRDRAIVAVLIYTAERIGEMAGLTVANFSHDGSRCVLTFLEKGGKVRDIPARADLDRYLSAYLEAAGLRSAPGDSRMFRRLTRKTRLLRPQAMTANDVGQTLKRRMAGIGLPDRLSPHPFRVATIKDSLTRGVPLKEVQHLVGRSCLPCRSLSDFI